VIYLDATVFLNAALNAGEIGGRARGLLAKTQNGETPAATSALTYGEIFWVIRKHRGFDAALEASKTLLEMPNLAILTVDVDVLWKAHGLGTTYKLHPRDAIHAACALANGIRTVVSEDEDFDRVKGLERKSLTLGRA
jgi:predicted nucleic acid-binding protein